MPLNRSYFRNVRFFDETTPDNFLGGLIQNGSLTEKNFLVMLDIVLVTTAPIRVSAKDTGSCEGEIRVSDEPWIHRTMCLQCVILGIVNRRAVIDTWTGFEAAHIFPLEKESLWIEFNYGRWVTDMDSTTEVSKINSLFDQYLLSVNPDDNYKIIVFDVDYLGLDGRTLDQGCRNPADPHSESDQLLRDAGEPNFEHDFPLGTDMMAEIREGPLV
ncbi:hypothetical protein BDD12DRAFT_989334 [Trichophaea hybrida]|nr:hypothetical protein BDD12DRAFT_989334 [Trichophaea hybrida]